MIDRSVLEIDEFALEKEWLRQSKLYFEWAERVAKAKKDLDIHKNRLEVVKAEVSLAVRQFPKNHGIEVKPTEKLIEAVVVTDEQVTSALQTVAKIRHRCEVASAMVGALDHKKTALSKLVDLFLASYYAEPRTKANRESVEEMKKNRAFKPKRIRDRKEDDS
jgi:hypothetical protein